jgi:ABC-type Na+ efflux pump permease subunit
MSLSNADSSTEPERKTHMLVLALMIPLMLLAVAIATVPVIAAMVREDRERRAALAAQRTEARVQRRAYPEAA